MRTLLLWGGRDEDGIPYLDPAFVVDAVPSLPVAEGEETSFVFALPVQSGRDNLASITLSGPGGSATLDESTNRPMAILRDSRTGQVRGFLRDPALAGTQVAADAVVGTAGRGLEMLLSRGIPDGDTWR